MRISFTKYEKAPLATACSLIGNLLGMSMVLVGFLGAISTDLVEGIISVVIGCGIIATANILSIKLAERATFKRRWKQIHESGLESQIKQSPAIAIHIYPKCPNKKAIHKIQELNPEAAEYI